MKIITVCGSLKFYKEMMEITEKMELQGNCILVSIYNSSKSSEIEFAKSLNKEIIYYTDLIK